MCLWRSWMVTGLALAVLTACEDSDPGPVGADRDAHGCVPSAGYQWCERTARCERPWELAERENIANSEEAVAAFCAAG